MYNKKAADFLRTKTRSQSCSFFASSKKALSPVVAVSLLLVVSVGAVVGFQTWFNQYSSSLFTDVEQSGDGNNIAQGINNFQNGNIYFNHKTNDNVTVTQVKTGDTTCDKNITLKQGINKIRGCTGKYTDLKDVVVYTDKGVYENKVFEKSLDIPFPCKNDNESNGFYGGDGSQSSPYQICSCNQLQNMSNNLFSDFELVTDLDCSATKNWNSGKGFAPVGNGANEFRGTLEGNDYTISNLFMNRSTSNRIGIFGKSRFGIELTNINFDNIKIYGDKYTGILGRIQGNGKFINISITNSQIEGGIQTGGIFGGKSNSADNLITIKNVVIDNTQIKGNQETGGFVGAGFTGDVKISNSKVINSNIEGSQRVGGLYGEGDVYTKNSQSINNYIKGSNAGGIGGQAKDLFNISSVDNTIEGGNNLGGIGGRILPNISKIKVISNIINGSSRVGGIGGESSNSDIDEVFVKNSTIIGSGNYVGGLIGERGSNALKINNSYVEDVSISNGNEYYTGATIGLADGTSSKLTNTYVTNVNISVPYNNGLGIVGDDSSITLENLYWNNETVIFTDAQGSEEGTQYITSDLQNPTSASGIYANWSSTIWNFGNTTEYPRFSWE